MGKDKFTFLITIDLKNIKRYSQRLKNLEVLIPFRNYMRFKEKDREKQIIEYLRFTEDIMNELMSFAKGRRKDG